MLVSRPIPRERGLSRSLEAPVHLCPWAYRNRHGARCYKGSVESRSATGSPQGCGTA